MATERSITGKNILVVSPQRWGVMRVSKHHYAIELAKAGNTVHFLNPPLPGLGAWFAARRDEEVDNLFLVDYHLAFPESLRFHFRALYDRLVRYQLVRLAARLGAPLDLVWCFETNLLTDLRVFGATKVVYHLADQVTCRTGIAAGATADLIVSVDGELLEGFHDVRVPQTVLGHGLASPFARRALAKLNGSETPARQPGPVRVGYVGNLLSTSLDRKTVQAVVAENPAVAFHFWGPCELRDSNVAGGETSDTRDFVQRLRGSDNVELHGAVTSEKLAAQMQEMDAFLVCYDYTSDINRCCNSHKILEYMSTGKAIISNRMSSYEAFGDLLTMPVDRHTNTELPLVFKTALSRLEELNQPLLQCRRMELALKNSYSNKIASVGEFLYGSD